MWPLLAIGYPTHDICCDQTVKRMHTHTHTQRVMLDCWRESSIVFVGFAVDAWINRLTDVNRCRLHECSGSTPFHTPSPLSAYQVCSTDNFWYLESKGEEYQFDLSRLKEAHHWCQQKACQEAESGSSPLVIDNTNIRAWNMRYYITLARRLHYTVILVTPKTPWRFDMETLSRRNVHCVAADKVESMIRNFEPVSPKYYGWFWPGPPSNSVQSKPNLLNGLYESSSCTNHASYHSNPSVPFPLSLKTKNFLQWAWDSFLILIQLPDVRVQLLAAIGLSDGRLWPCVGFDLLLCSRPTLVVIWYVYVSH